MAERNWRYERFNENHEIETCPQDDKDGAVTGKCILNLPVWFDENPEERKRLGWIKHIFHDVKDFFPEFNRQTHYAVKVETQIDEYTVEDSYRLMQKSEEQLMFEEMLAVANGEDGMIWFGF